MYIIDDEPQTNPNQHKESDTVATLNLAFHHEVTQGLIAAIAHIAQVNTPTTSTSTFTSTTTITNLKKPCPAEKVLGEDDPKLEQLREFRESTLIKSALGRRIIEIYYNNADSINAALESRPLLRAACKSILEAIAPTKEKSR